MGLGGGGGGLRFWQRLRDPKFYQYLALCAIAADGSWGEGGGGEYCDPV